MLVGIIIAAVVYVACGLYLSFSKEGRKNSIKRKRGPGWLP